MQIAEAKQEKRKKRSEKREAKKEKRKKAVAAGVQQADGDSTDLAQ